MKQDHKHPLPRFRFPRLVAPSVESFWLYALVGFAALVALELAASWYVFARVGRSDGPVAAYAPESGAVAETVDRARLDAALRFFEERAARFEEIRVGDSLAPTPHDE